jgi:hypothetical protein
MEFLLRFVIGGFLVSFFAVIGCLFRPRSFGGLFAAAPTIALATLSMAFCREGAEAVSLEGRSMIFGAMGLSVYSGLAAYLLLRRNWSALPSSLLALLAWFAESFGLWALFLKLGAP